VSATSLPLVEHLWQASTRAARVTRVIVLVVAGTAVLAVSAKVQVPFVPVPFTMQTAVVLVIGLTYGMRLGVATVAAYLAEGAAGLPVFAAGGGAAYLLSSPTAGYLWGMLAAAGLMGVLAERGWDRTIPKALGAMLIGTAAIFAVGIGRLAYMIGAGPAVDAGLVPFLGSEALKIALVAVTLPTVRGLVDRGLGAADRD